MMTAITSVPPYAAGKSKPQGVELVDVNGDAVGLIYGETRAEAQAVAERIASLLNEHGTTSEVAT